MPAVAVPVAAVTFDAGQTLVELDTGLLAERLAERGHAISSQALDAATAAAWRHYDRLVAGGALHPWQGFMDAVLAGADPALDAEPRRGLVEWLWHEQPRRNLWRRPVPGMIELAGELAAAGIAVAVISNSEGKLAALFDEIGWQGRFAAVADSGALGIEKPLAGIFTWTCERIGVAPAAVVHIGDSRAADVEGALAIGMRAIWFGPAAHAVDDDRVRACADAAAVRAALRGWGVAV
jgi:HAD superfamily hydrolase (TIGR01509 family)